MNEKGWISRILKFIFIDIPKAILIDQIIVPIAFFMFVLGPMVYLATSINNGTLLIIALGAYIILATTVLIFIAKKVARFSEKKKVRE